MALVSAVLLATFWNGPLVAFQGLEETWGKGSGQAPSVDQPRVEFARDVLPIVSNKCFRCHGPDEKSREADLRLDMRQSALEYEAIVPGDVVGSELIARITSTDSDRMPPHDSGVDAITPDDLAVLKRWISQGAKWQVHWSFVPPELPELPALEEATTRDRVSNTIDRFVLARLKEWNLAPSPRADKPTLARRVSLLLTGLPPSEQTLNRFLRDDSPQAYEKLVDHLLDSEAFGERMAAQWMDVARYSDTDGFQADEPRSNWPWRDWVIKAYNANMPFNQFTIEQFAGDLLPNATSSQILATCFHRNHMTNGEGGRDPEESRVDYVLDRVNTTGTVWLGLTLGCAQCHTHKYDPITQTDYYRLTAFFNSIDEDGRAGRKAQKPYLDWQLEDPEPLLRGPRQHLAQQEKGLRNSLESVQEQFGDWVKVALQERSELLKNVDVADWKTFQIDHVTANDPTVEFQREEDGVWRNDRGNPNIETYVVTGSSEHSRIGAIRIQALPHPSFTAGGLARSDSGNFVLTDVVATIVRAPNDEPESDDSVSRTIERIPLKFDSAWADYAQPGYAVDAAIDNQIDTGWAVLGGDMKQPRTCVLRLDKSVALQDGDRLEIQLVHFSHHARHNIGRFRISTSPKVNAAEPTDLVSILAKMADPQSPTAAEREQLLAYAIDHDGNVGLAKASLARARQSLQQAKAKNTVPVMVLKARTEARDSFVLERGVWDAHGDAVRPATPESLQPALPESTNPDRLQLARWLVDRRNPLTARVTVNRYWQMYFGAGLVRTPQDFGLQGQQPTHPLLLDWLAVQFMESGWDVKQMHKLIVMSSTFQQSSIRRPALLGIDPENRWLARGPRFRMPVAMIRDNALAVSGLLTGRVGGPPVKPYQPDNVWAASDQGRYPYEPSLGPDLYRRSLYTYWRRNIAPPGMFDAAQRRVCEVKMRRTNSPMHALTLLNDVTYVEAARVLAESVFQESEPTNESKKELDRESARMLVDRLFQRVLMRSATDVEVDVLTKTLTDLQTEYQRSPGLAGELLNVGDRPVDPSRPAYQLAALTVVASTVLNLDETLNIE